MRRTQHGMLALALAGGSLLAGCATDDETALTLTGPAANEAVASLFVRYVALGNSITAGYQSGGINDSTQLRAYPVMLAQQAGFGSVFGVPLLARPGCPAPFTGPLSPVRVGGVPASVCALRSTPAPALVQNLAVPGAQIGSALNRETAANALTTFVLGGRTQIEAMEAANPTMVSVWLGNNDALGAALGGTTALLTTLANFQTNLTGIADRIAPTPAGQRGAVVLIGTVDPQVAPALQPGAYFFLAAQATNGRFGGPNGPQVSPSCAPGQPGGSNLISIQMLSDPVYAQDGVGIQCSNDYMPPNAPAGYFPGRYVLTQAEAAAVSARVAEFNTATQSLATQRNWIYVNPNALLPLNDPNAIRKCQALPAALQSGNPATIQQAIVTTCPSADAAIGFGTLISYDGVHPSTAAHRLIANAILTQLNTRFSVQIPTIN
jgi:lysophospholipase L1-like esterase